MVNRIQQPSRATTSSPGSVTGAVCSVLLALVLVSPLPAGEPPTAGASVTPTSSGVSAATPTPVPCPPHEPAARVPTSALLVFLLAALVILGTAWRAVHSQLHQAALVAVAPALPVVASVAAVALYLVWQTSWLAPAAGIMVALILCCAAALCGARFMTAERCVPTSNGELIHRLTQLEGRLAEAAKTAQDGAALAQAHAQYDAMKKELASDSEVWKGLPWVMGTGYVTLWKRLHRAEEAMIEVLPREVVVGQALKDELRLTDSRIQKNKDLLDKLRRAVVELDPSARFLLTLSADEAKGLRGFLSEGGGTPSAEHHKDARSVLRMIRRAINEYQDDLYGGLVTSRNRTLATAIVTGLAAFFLLAVPMTVGVSRPSIVAAAIFFLVGATVGLLNRLRHESEESTDVLDYGLSAARLWATPLHSGLAAVGGVVLTVLLSSAAAVVPEGSPTPVPTPVRVESLSKIGADSAANVPSRAADSPTPAPAEGRQRSEKGHTHDEKPTGPPPQLAVIFDLGKNTKGILEAALFGLTPGLLFSRLQQQSEKYKSDLKSTEPTQGKAET